MFVRHSMVSHVSTNNNINETLLKRHALSERNVNSSLRRLKCMEYLSLFFFSFTGGGRGASGSLVTCMSERHLVSLYCFPGGKSRPLKQVILNNSKI